MSSLDSSDLASLLPFIIANIFTAVGGFFAAGFMLLIFAIFYKALRQSNLSDLFKGEVKNEMSMTKFWTNVAYFSATLAFLAINMMNAATVPGTGLEVIWLIYLGVVASNAAVSKWLALRYGSDTTAQRDSPETGESTNPRGRPRHGAGRDDFDKDQ